MKSTILIAITVFVLSACAGGGPAAVDKPASPNLVNAAGNEEEYELTIIDPGFQQWFASYGKPVTYHSPEYYARQNLQYAQQWNQLASQPQRGRGDYPFENQIDYRSGINYGVKLNYELYWYFRYIESMYGQQYNFGFGRRNAMF